MLRGPLVFLTAILVLSGAAGGADQITVKRIPYADVLITDVKDGMISFRTSAGEATRSLRDVDLIQLGRDDPFNRAEKLRADGNAARAVPAYDAAAKTARAGSWQERLIRCRRLTAASQAGLIDRAVEDWLACMDESPAAKEVLALRPAAAAKGPANVKAIASLESKLKSVTDKSYQAAIKGLLLVLYEKEGLTEKASALAAEISGAGSTPAAGSLRDQLQGLELRLSQGQAAEVLADIQKNLDAYGEADLPKALLLAGKAQTRLAEAAKDAEGRKKALAAAGLDFMRVYTYFARSAEAPEALYLAGQANASLPQPNAAAAAAAYEKVIKEYASSPFAASAKAALEKIKK